MIRMFVLEASGTHMHRMLHWYIQLQLGVSCLSYVAVCDVYDSHPWLMTHHVAPWYCLTSRLVSGHNGPYLGISGSSVARLCQLCSFTLSHVSGICPKGVLGEEAANGLGPTCSGDCCAARAVDACIFCTAVQNTGTSTPRLLSLVADTPES